MGATRRGFAIDHTDPEVVALTPTPAPTPRIIALAWHGDRHRSAAATAFTEMASELAEEISEMSITVAP